MALNSCPRTVCIQVLCVHLLTSHSNRPHNFVVCSLSTFRGTKLKFNDQLRFIRSDTTHAYVNKRSRNYLKQFWSQINFQTLTADGPVYPVNLSGLSTRSQQTASGDARSVVECLSFVSIVSITFKLTFITCKQLLLNVNVTIGIQFTT